MMTDIVDDLRKDPYEEERQYKREARLELGGILDKAADEIVKLREALLDAVKFVSRADSLFLKEATTDTLKGIPDGYR